MPEPVHKIRITDVPLGEAPDWVRAAWVGLELLVVHRSHAVTMPGFGVITMPRSWLGMVWGRVSGKATRITGYLVSAGDAVELLADSNPQAAQWWRDNTPHLIQPRRTFLFNIEACTPIG
jgi:hypothetical protein